MLLSISILLYYQVKMMVQEDLTWLEKMMAWSRKNR